MKVDQIFVNQKTGMLSEVKKSQVPKKIPAHWKRAVEMTTEEWIRIVDMWRHRAAEERRKVDECECKRSEGD